MRLRVCAICGGDDVGSEDLPLYANARHGQWGSKLGS